MVRFSRKRRAICWIGRLARKRLLGAGPVVVGDEYLVGTTVQNESARPKFAREIDDLAEVGTSNHREESGTWRGKGGAEMFFSQHCVSPCLRGYFDGSLFSLLS